MSLFQSPELALSAIVAAYLLGAIPFGLLFSRWLTGKDPREHGSGNIGATNALRTGGKKVGVLTLLADIAKGVLPVSLAIAFEDDAWLVAAVALAAFLGHVFPVYLKFKGGKGVATMFGVLLPWLPWVAVGAFIVWFVTYKITRYVSLASILAGLSLPILTYVLTAYASVEFSAVLASLVLGVLMVSRHRENIQRLWAGTEPKTGGA
ncbi:MAG: glycerol-3-phosphate 1-O-acyltransferase PlsY [Mariprofundaceae bacterium]